MLKRKSIVFILLAVALPAQSRYPRSRGVGNPSLNPLPTYQGLTATFHGTLKELDKKEIVIQNDDDQTVTIRRNSKTKFYKDGKEVKADALEPDTLVTVDATEDKDSKPVALKVTGDPGQKSKDKPGLVKR